MFFNYRLFFRQFFRSLFSGKNSDLRLGPKRIRFFVFFCVLFPWLLFFSRFFFLLDHIFFGGFRRQPVEGPVFILGNFRSGSTMLQRLLAKDTDNFSAIRSWEIYAAPSISQRKLLRGVKIVDGWFGAPLFRRLLSWEAGVLKQVKIHRIGVFEPEEDEGLFFYVWYSLFIWFFFPTAIEGARFDRFDEFVPGPRRRRVLRFYRNCIKRHLYAHGGKTYLSKNPSHTGRIDSLLREFPDARIIYLARDPGETISSSLSWFTFCWNYFTDMENTRPYTDLILEMVEHFYSYPYRQLASVRETNRMIVRYEDLVRNLEAIVATIYRRFSVPLTDDFRGALSRTANRARSYKSKHDHTLDDAGISDERIKKRFGHLYSRYAK